MQSITDVVHSDPTILGGTPVFVKTQVPLSNLIGYLGRGDSLDSFLKAFPAVSRERARAALNAAHEALVARVHDPGSPRLPRSMVLWFLAGATLIAGSSYLPCLHATVPGEIFRDFGIAFCISVVVAGIIELHLSQQTFVRGLDAIMQRTVPDDVWEVFRQHVVTQPMIRENWVLTMTMIETSAGVCESHTAMSYTISSLQPLSDKDYVRHELDSHRTPPGATTRYTRAKIGKDAYLSPAELAAAKVLSDNGLTLQLPVNLKRPNQTVDVELEFMERVTCPDTIVWWMSKVTRNVTLKINNVPDSWCVEVKTFHPAGDQLAKIGSMEWEFVGIMLPGQGVEIRIKKV